MATPTAKNGKCPEGYTHVFGPLCVEKTTLDKVSDALPDIPDADSLTIPSTGPGSSWTAP